MRLSQRRVNVEAAEGLDLVLRGTIPDRVGAPEHIVLADVLQELAQEVRGGGRIAHDKTPGRAELGVDVGVAADAIVLDRLDQGVDAARGMRGIIGTLSGARLVARVVNDEVHVGVEPGGAADVGAPSQFLGKAREQQALMDADVAHPELARPFDERDANVGTVERKAAAVRAPLRVTLPGRDRVTIHRIFHELERRDVGAGIRHDHGVEKKARGASHSVNQDADPVRLLERQWVILRQFWHEREHREVGVAVHEHVLDELLCRKAGDRVVGAAGPLREAGEDALPVLAGGAAPGAGWVDHVGLDVEDELVAGDRLGRRRGLECALLGYAELPTDVAERRERFV